MNRFISLFTSRLFLIAFPLAIACVVMFHRLGEVPLGGDDCYYSEVAKEMSRTGDYLTPRNGYHPDFHTSKPPILFWINAFSGNLFGFDTFAMRLPSAILGVIGVTATAFFALRYFSPLTAFFSALILTFTQQYLYHARSAVTDGPFAVLFGLALFAFWMARTGNRASLWYLTGLFIGLGVMTRQVPGLFVYAVILAYIAFAGEWKLFKNPHAYGMVLISFAVFLPWHIIMYLKHGMAFLKQYIGVTLMTGITGYPEGYSSSPSLNPWYAYFSIIASNYWPWLPFLLVGLYQAVRGAVKSEGEERNKDIFLLAWILAPLAIFQLAKVKQYHYITPLYVPFALLSARVFDRFREPSRTRAAAVLAILVTLLSASYLLFPVIPKTLDSHEFVDTITLAREVRKLGGDINALHEGFCHYNNCFWFYGDHKSIPNTEQEMIAKIRSDAPAYFVLPRETYPRIRAAAGRPLRIIKESKNSILFSNR